MKEEICKWIKQQVYQHIVPANYGRVSLDEVYRLFSDYGSIQNLERCMDIFVKERFARKITNDNGAIIYVFGNIASKYERKWREDLEDLLIRRDEMLREKERKENMIKVLNEIYNVWSIGWRNVGDPQTETSVKNYVAIFWNSVIKETIEYLKQLEEKIKSIEREIKKMKNLIGEP